MDPYLLAALRRALLWAIDAAREPGPEDQQKAGEIEQTLAQLDADQLQASRAGQSEFTEAGWLREVITRAAQDLERLGNAKGRSEEAKRVLLERARRMRQQMQDGAPAGWKATGSAGSDRSDERN